MSGSGRAGSESAAPQSKGKGSSAETQKAKETDGTNAAESPFALLNNQPKMELFDNLADAPAPVSSKPRFEPKAKSRGPQAKSKASKKPVDAAPSFFSNSVKPESLQSPERGGPAQSSAPANAELRENVDLTCSRNVKVEPDWEVKAEEVGMRVEGGKVKIEGGEIPSAHGAMDWVRSEAPPLPQGEQPLVAGDQVVREIDVFLSRSATTEKQVRVKAKPKRLEVDLAVDTDCENYNDDAEESIKIRTQTLSSTKAPPTRTYAIGVLKGNQLHLNPLHAIVQLRPSMKHLDNIEEEKKKQDRKAKEASSAAAAGDEEMVEADAVEDKAPELVALQVDVRRKETEWQEESRLQSHAYLKELDDMEPWIVLEPHGIDSPESSSLRRQMIAGTTSQIPFKMKPKEYINKLVPGQGVTVSNEVTTGDGGGSTSFSRSYLDTLPLEERFHQILSKGQVHVLPFDRLMKLAPEGCGEQELLNVLKEIAVLVQGCWVVGSRLRYSKPITIIRDYLLLLFHKSRIVKHSQLEDLHISKDTLREILRDVAVQQGPMASWEFLESTDKAFIKRHQAVAKEQFQKWMELETHLREAVHSLQLPGTPRTGTGALKVDLLSIKEIPTKPTIQPGLTRRPQSADNAKEVHFNLPGKGSTASGSKSLTTHSSGPSTLPEATLAALPNALKNIFAKHNVCSLQVICHTLREDAILAAGGSNKDPIRKAAAEEAKAAAQAAGAPVEELKEAVSEVATNISGVYFLSTLGNASLDPFRNVVIALLRAKGPGSGLRKTDIMEASKIALKTEVPQATYQKVLKELCYTKSGAWVLKPGDGRP